jgi:hypothetical protein
MSDGGLSFHKAWVRERGLKGWEKGLSLGAEALGSNNLLLFQITV